ncbi:MAG TPA: hypothetical protein PKZ68_02235 [Pseudomonadales bacterium]|jgi:hypothetical protein|nr:hypothetical protein [Pseudomonadales bacterium]HNL91679.1 hypothetical protein [Pseudomonadales bacterium]HNN86490.1 hypothetical protein [Pseudomonadales bacterium]
MSEHTAVETHQGKYLLLTLMLIPILVVLAATFVFYTGIGVPKETHNKGVLITPPQQINDIHPVAANGAPFVFERKNPVIWTFLTAHRATCGDDCRQRFWVNRQTRTALGKYREHIRRVWLVTEGRLDSETEQWLKKEHEDVIVLQSDDAQWKKLLSQSNYRSVDESQTNFFLVDPRGFVMMYYTAQNTYKDVMADMKFLLKDVE